MSPIHRRDLLHATVTLAVSGSVLAACSSGGTPSAPGGAAPGGGGEHVPAPSYVPVASVEPDIKGDADIPDTYFRYPANPARSVPQPPGDGNPIAILTQTFAAVTPTAPANTVWAQLNEKIGSELQIQQIPQSEYVNKFATSLAGGQLPDMFFIAEQPDMPRMVEATCLDLSEHLSGEAIKKYPNLAAIPTEAWEVGRFNGKLYGLPSPRGAMSSGILYRRDDLLSAKGIAPEWKSFQEFFDLCQEVNDPRGGRWALTVVPGQYIKNMLGIPNFWKYTGDAMESWWTSPRIEEALEAQRKVSEAGLHHPDAFSAPNTKTWFNTDLAYFNPDSFSAWAQYMASAQGSFDIDGCEIPAFDGNGTGHMWMSFPSFGRSAINKNAADRVEVLLGVANYLAAPFGTQEYLDVKFGKEGADYTMDDGNPTPTQQGATNRELGVKYIADAAQVNFLPGHEESARKLDALIRKLVPDAYRNDAVYLQSDAVSKDFEGDAKEFSALESDIVQGRKAVSEWRPAADAWWKERGQKMSDELVAAYREAGRG